MDFYRQRRAEGDWLILDNGEAEGARVDYQQLLTVAAQLEVQEIVVPDVLNNCDETIKHARNFFSYLFGGTHPYLTSPLQYYNFQFMGVIQGQILAEYLKCLHFFEREAWISTLALPRAMNYNIDRTSRYTLAEGLINYGSRFGTAETKNIHCLGSSNWIREVAALGELPNVRSMDTSLPVVLGLEGISVQANVHQPRRNNFFGQTISRASNEWEITYDNCITFRDWAGDSSPFDESGNPEASSS